MEGGWFNLQVEQAVMAGSSIALVNAIHFKGSGMPNLARPTQRLGARHYTVSITFRVVLERDPETGDYSAVCPELPGCASAGETEAEARANIREAIELYLTPGDIDLPEDVTVG
jgi:predicted RNase H-like HicB family nuclease